MTLPSDYLKYRKFLVIQTASIGDVILATPVIEKIHRHYPNGNIDFLLKRGNDSLFESHPFLHKVITWDKSENKYKNLFELISFIRKQKYDCVINIHRFASSGLITALSGAKHKIGFNKNPFSFLFNTRIKHTISIGNIHETERNLDLIRSITDDSSSPVKLYPGQNHFAKVSQLKVVKYITISPSSLWFTKQFPFEKWVEFIRETDKNLRIYFLGSKNDYEFCERIIKDSSHIESLNLSGKLHFLESAALMKDAAMNFTNDSAPMHLASSVNAPVTAIYCSTVPEFGFGPLSDNSQIVQTLIKLDCRPCGLHGFDKCPKKHFKCALTIDKSVLLNRI
jgi:heptosyltransferase II